MRWYQRFFRREITERQLDAELRFHLEQRTADLVATGLAPEEARRRAQWELGGLEQVKEECREVGATHFLETSIQDLRYGSRMMLKNRGFTAAAVLTLALGIGANTTIFSVAWRPMRYRDAGRLLMVWETRPDGSRSPVSIPTYLDWRDRNRSFEQLAAARSASFALSGNPPLLVSGARVTANFFDTFRLQPERGRFFSAQEFRVEGNKVTILSHEMWQTQFAGAADIVGKTVRLNGETYVVVGIAPADFEFMGRIDVWMPLVLSSAAAGRGSRDLLVVGRMKPGFTTPQAEEEMRTLAARVAQQSPETNQHWSALAQSFYQALAGPGVLLMMVLLFATVCVVLLLACVNVANLLLARAPTRQKEIAVRLAYGASRWRLVRQLLAETLLLALVGGVFGLLLAFGAVNYLATLPVLQAPSLAPIEINHPVLEFALVLSVASTVLSGFVPAWRTTAANLIEHVKAAAHTTLGDRKQNRLRNVLVMAELALSVVLMVTAGLTLRSFIRLAQVDPGFPCRGLLTAHVSLPAPQYADTGRVRRFNSQLLENLRAIPGVEDAALSTSLPPANFDNGQPFRVEGRDPASADASGVGDYQVVSAGFFRTLGLRVLKGRAFSEDDQQASTAVAIVNRRLADKFFSTSDPLGKRLLVSELIPGRSEPSEPVALQVVGVVNDLKNLRVNEPSSPEIYIPYPQAPWSSEYLVVRSHGETGSLLAAIRNAVSAVDPDLPLTDVSTMDERLSRSLAGGRVVVTLMVIFAFMALSMGSVGLYGVISYSAVQRTSEFALRLALGAPRREVLRLVAGGALRLLLIGGAVGMALALGMARLLSSSIFGISPYDPVTFAVVSLVLVAVVVGASYLPARRATKVDPMVALRYE